MIPAGFSFKTISLGGGGGGRVLDEVGEGIRGFRVHKSLALSP